MAKRKNRLHRTGTTISTIDFEHQLWQRDALQGSMDALQAKVENSKSRQHKTAAGPGALLPTILDKVLMGEP